MQRKSVKNQLEIQIIYIKYSEIKYVKTDLLHIILYYIHVRSNSK